MAAPPPPPLRTLAEAQESDLVHVDGWNCVPRGWEYLDELHDDDLSSAAPLARSPAPPPPELQDKEFDAIVVLAGGLDDEGKLHEWVKRRLLAAVDMYRYLLEKNDGRETVHMLVLGGGTYHKPHFRNQSGFAVHESTACADFLVNHGVSKLRISKEWSSYDTIANAFFCRTNHTDLRGWKDLLVVTSDFHLPRSRDIFEWVYGLPGQPQPERGAGGDEVVVARPPSVQLSFLGVSDSGFDEEMMADRVQREARSRTNLAKTRASIVTLAQFHHWFFFEHNAYNVSALENDKRGVGISSATLKSY